MITDIQENTTITDFMMVTKCEQRSDKRGKPYLCLTFADSTGSVEGRYWDNDERVEVGALMKVRAEASEYNGELQLKVVQWRPTAEEDGIPLSHYIRYSSRDRTDMLCEVQGFRYEDKQVKLVMSYLTNTYQDALLVSPAAMKNHQPYVGGLMEHILNLKALVDAMLKLYPLNADVLTAACVVHDLGKLYELQVTPAIAYTRRGTLIGHVGIGLQMWAEAVDVCEKVTATEFDSVHLVHIEHIIASHHGIKEWGALQEPASREAVMFHQLDMIDSRMGMWDETAVSLKDEFNWIKGQNYWRPTV